MDTITAIATSLVPAGIGIIRISGERALEIAKSIFVKKSTEWVPNYMYLGTINGETFKEQAFCVYFKAPFSYTGEDVAEFHCHGGEGVLGAVLRLIYERGARQACAGEFTRRAFLNGKINLAQAEGICELINAENEAGVMQAYRLASGEVSAVICRCEQTLLAAAANLEAMLDYPEELEEDLSAPTLELLKDAAQKLQKLYKDAQNRRFIREGINVVIAGAPNAGKSSLLNALLQDERAIVTDIAGTTRDTICENIVIEGIKYRFTDTAGMREGGDTIEKMGIERTKKAVAGADLIVHILDLSAEGEEDLSGLLQDKAVITAGNKLDIKKYDKPADIYISCKTGENIDRLIDLIKCKVDARALTDTVIMTNERHTACVKTAVEALESAIQNYYKITADCTAVDVRKAYSALAAVTGSDVNESIVDEIFSNFCVGK
jgi:tRNA modification GTPase